MQRIRLNRESECEPGYFSSPGEETKVDDARHQLFVFAYFYLRKKLPPGWHRRLGAINYRRDNGREHSPWISLITTHVTEFARSHRYISKIRSSKRGRETGSLLKFAILAILLVWKLNLASDRQYRCFSTDKRVFNVDTLPSLLTGCRYRYYSNKIVHPSITTNKMFICVVKIYVTCQY